LNSGALPTRRAVEDASQIAQGLAAAHDKGIEPQNLSGWLPKDIWITWSADGRSAYVYHDDKTSAPVYRLDVATGKRELVMTLGPNDSAGVTAIQNLRITPDGKSYAYSFSRELSDLFLVDGAR
jgi:Tol biopolymer transport system component